MGEPEPVGDIEMNDEDHSPGAAEAQDANKENTM